LVRAQAMQTVNQPMQEVLSWIEFDAARGPLRELAEVGRDVEEKINACREQDEPPQAAFRRD
jgi:hypothetical protein